MIKLYPNKVAFYYEQIYWNSYNNSVVNTFFSLNRIKALRDEKSKTFLKALKMFEKFQGKRELLSGMTISIDSKEENPDPAKFIKLLSARINKMKALNKEADTIFALGHGQFSVLVYDELVKLTSSFSIEVMKYYIPILDKGFQKQFKSEMQKISLNMKKESSKYQNLSQNLIEKYQLLINNRVESHTAFDILQVSDIRPPASKLAITFELGN